MDLTELPLSENYKVETKKIKDIKNIKDFNSSFCSILHYDEVLFHYLAYLDELESSNKNPEEEKVVRFSQI